MEKIKAIWDSIKVPRWFKVAFVAVILLAVASAVFAKPGDCYYTGAYRSPNEFLATEYPSYILDPASVAVLADDGVWYFEAMKGHSRLAFAAMLNATGGVDTASGLVCEVPIGEAA